MKKLKLMSMLLVSLVVGILSIIPVAADTGSSVAKLTGEIFSIVIVFLPLGVLFVFLYYLSDIIPFLKRFIPF
jgi:hypothetical protein